jgi:hypothetical protein
MMRAMMVGAMLAAALLTLSGCVSFGGPKDVERAISRAGSVRLECEEGICVGPLGILFAQVVAGSALPVSLDGVSSVDVGSYRVVSCDRPLCVETLALPGWERVVHVRDEGSSMVLMVNEDGDSIRGLLVLQHEGDRLEIVRARGRLDRTLESAVDLVMEDEDMGDFLDEPIWRRSPPSPPAVCSSGD